jgi:hypothetical protein
VSLDKPSDDLSWDDTLTPSNLSVTVRFHTSSEEIPLPSCLRLESASENDRDRACGSEVQTQWKWKHKAKTGESAYLVHEITEEDITAIAAVAPMTGVVRVV